MFYRKDLFEKAGITGEPKTWDEFLDACKKLKAAGIAPIAVAGRDAWTLAGWFDYLDLRINGNAFHEQLMAGDIAVHRSAREEGLHDVEAADRRRVLHRQLALLRSGFGAAVPVQGQGRDDADGHVLLGGFLPSVKPEDGLLPVPDHRLEGADGRRRSGRIAAYPVEGQEQGGRARVSLRSWRRRRSTVQLAKGWGRCRRTASRRNRRTRSRRSASRSCEHEGRHCAVLRSRHDQGNGRRGHEGDAAVLWRSVASSTRCWRNSNRPASASTRSKREGIPGLCVSRSAS